MEKVSQLIERLELFGGLKMSEQSAREITESIKKLEEENEKFKKENEELKVLFSHSREKVKEIETDLKRTQKALAEERMIF